MVTAKLARSVVTCAVLAVVTLGGVAACAGQGTATSCTLSACTVEFDRGVEGASTEVLGVTVELVSATDTTVTLKVAGQEVTIDNGQSVSTGDFDVTLESIDEAQAVVKIARAA